MEICLSAVLAELTTRSVNFFVSKHSKPPALDVEDHLRRVLLRVEVIIDEAMGRHITNRAMLQQLGMLSDAMHRGYYTLDIFRYQYHDKEEAKGQIVSQYSLLSKVNSVKDLCFSSGTNAKILEELQEVLDSLSTMIRDANELVIFLKSYPHLYRQPYSMHILLSNCMFDRQMERELVINFLLHTQPHHAKELEVLPIVGPGRVGKSTLVAHICNDERIRDHFSEIVFLSDHDLSDERLSVLREGCAMEHHNCASNKTGELLVVVEVAADVNEDAWRKLCSACKRCAGTKIIITSRSDKIKKLGTTRAITLKYLSNEAYWYFFKTLTFGSTDPEKHPRLAYMAMEIAKTLNGTFIGANINACLLRDNLDIHFWCRVLAFKRRLVQKHISKFGEHPSDLLNQNRPTHIGRIGTASEDIIVHDQYQCSSQEVVPSITFQDVLYGSVKPRGKFEVLAWRSRIPPYYSHVYTCEIQELKTTVAKRKRSTKSRVILR